MSNFFQRWFPDDIHHQADFFDEIKRRLPEAGKLLDLGCGANIHLGHLRMPANEVWGVDFQAHSQLRDPAWFRLLGPAGEIPFPNGTFDVVACNMVLEHVADPRAFFAEVARVLKPGGHFVALSISGIHYVTWIRRAFDLAPHWLVQRLVRKLYGRDDEDTFPTRYRANTKRQLERAGRARGFELVRMRHHACAGYFEFSWVLWRLSIVVDWMLDKLHPGLGRIYFVATLRKS